MSKQSNECRSSSIPKRVVATSGIGRCVVLAIALGAFGCASDVGGAALDDSTSPGVGQGGAQDIGAFREQLDQQQVPTDELLDDVGFFNEHKIELPRATCNQPICLHAALGVMGNMINGANCTMLFLGMNTALDPENIARKPLNLALAIDTSGSMAGAPIENVQIGLEMMLDTLREDDRVSLVIFSDGARTLVSQAPPDSVELLLAIRSLVADGSTNIYDGLALAYAELAASDSAASDSAASDSADSDSADSDSADSDLSDREERVLLLSDGESNVGLSSDDRLLGLSSAYADAGIALSTIGFGSGFDTELLRQLSVIGQGSYYFTDAPLALREIFTEEVQTSLVPLARDAEIAVEIAKGYKVRGVYGTEVVKFDDDSVRITLPVLQIAQRTSVADNALGRRGGGGVVIVELTPDVNTESESNAIGRAELTYVAASGAEVGKELSQVVDIASPFAPGETPAGGHFDDASVEKGFVMLNIYAGIRAALLDTEAGDWAGANGSLTALEASVVDWLEQNPDDDIIADLEIIRALQDLVEPRAMDATTLAPRPPWPVD